MLGGLVRVGTIALSSVALVVFGMPAAPHDAAAARAAAPNDTSVSPGGADASSAPDVVELVARRTATSRTYALPDGTFPTEAFAGPIHYRDADGAWRRIDNRLVPSSRPGYAYENAANSYTLYLPEDVADTPVRIESNDHWVEFELHGASGSPTAAGAEAVYDGVLPGVDVVYEARPSGVKEAFVLSGPDALSSFTFSLRTSAGVTATANEVGGIDVETSDGDVVASLDAPVAYDAAGRETTGRHISYDVVRTRSGLAVALVTDPGWLADPARRYPVVVDPTYTLRPPSRDCWIGNGGIETSSNCGSGSDYVRVGYTGSAKRRGLLRFDLSSIPSTATVASGIVSLYMDHTKTTGLAKNADYVLSRAKKPWTNSATWHRYDGVNSWSTAGGDFGTTDAGRRTLSGQSSGYRSFDATWLVRDWVTGVFANNGVVAKQASEATDTVLHFVSGDHPEAADKAPKLVVDFSESTPAKFEGIGERDFYKFEAQRLNDRNELKVNVATGNLLLKATDLSISGTGLDLTLDRFYNSLTTSYDEADLSQGWFWGTGSTVRLEFPNDAPGRAVFVGPSGYRVRFDKNPEGTYAPAAEPGIHATLEHHDTANEYVLEWHDKSKYVFDETTGDLKIHKDQNGNDIAFAYDASGNLTRITDTQNRTVTFSYAGGLVSTVTDSSVGRTFRYSYQQFAGTPDYRRTPTTASDGSTG